MEHQREPLTKAPDSPGPKDQEYRRSSVKYTPIPGHGHYGALGKPVHNHVDETTWGGWLVKAVWFQNLMGLVIIANSAVLGMETDMGEFPLDGLHWNDIEDGFLIVFLAEILLKICVEGCYFFHHEHEDFVWNYFDMLIVGLGAFDMFARYILERSGTGGFATVFRTFRLMRILRIFRLLKFLKRLYLLAMGLIEAAKAIFWVTILMCFVLYICALVLVKTVGRPPESDPHYDFLDYHFGSIPESMISLFILMSSPNLPIFQEEKGLLDTHIVLTLFLIMFITFGSFGMIAMLTGVINESMFENNEMHKEEKRHQHELMRVSLGDKCADIFMGLEQNEDGEAYVSEVQRVAGDVVQLVEAAGAHIAHGDTTKIIAHMDIDHSGTVSIVEFVDTIEKLAEGLSPMAILDVHHSVGHSNKKLDDLDAKVDTIKETLEHIQRSVENLEKRGSNPDSMQTTVSQMAEMGRSIQMLSDQIGSSESRLQYAVSRQVGEIGTSVQKMTEMQVKKQDVQLLSHPGEQLGQQIDEIQKSLQKLIDEKQKEGSRDTLKYSSPMQPHPSHTAAVERVGLSIQQLHDKMNTGGEQAVVSQQISEVQKSVDRLVEKDNGNSRSQLAVAGQMQAIGSSVQKLLQTKEGQDVQNSQELEKLRTSVQRLFEQALQSSDRSVQQLQRQVDSAQENLLSGVAELGGVVLGGVGDLLSKKMAAMQTSILSELAASQELSLQKLLAVGLPEADATLAELRQKIQMLEAYV